MEAGHFVALIFWLILAGIVARHWTGANTLLGTAGSVGNTTIKNLEA